MCVRKIFLAALGVLIMLASLSADVSAAPMAQEVKVGNSTVKLGDKIEKAIAAFGKPWHIAANENYYWRDRVDLYSPEVVAKAYYGTKKIYALIVDRVPTINTPEGIGVGSSKYDVIKAYGKGRERKVSNGDVIMSYGKDEALAPYMRFRFKAGTDKVSYYVIGKPDKPKSKKRR